MTLDEWMRLRGLGDAAVAVYAQVHRATVSKLRRGKKLPSARLMARFANLTNGKVSPNDWFAAGSPKPVGKQRHRHRNL